MLVCICQCNTSCFRDRSVQQLLLQGANPNLVGTKGVAAVHLSVGKETEKNIRCLKTLLQYGADPNIRYRSKTVTSHHIHLVTIVYFKSKKQDSFSALVLGF